MKLINRNIGEHSKIKQFDVLMSSIPTTPNKEKDSNETYSLLLYYLKNVN